MPGAPVDNGVGAMLSDEEASGAVASSEIPVSDSDAAATNEQTPPPEAPDMADAVLDSEADDAPEPGDVEAPLDTEEKGRSLRITREGLMH